MFEIQGDGKEEDEGRRMRRRRRRDGAAVELNTGKRVNVRARLGQETKKHQKILIVCLLKCVI